MKSQVRVGVWLAPGLAASLLLIAGCGSGGEAAVSTAPGVVILATAAAGDPDVLLDAQALTVLDQPVRYPKKKAAEISSAILALDPGQETGWHKYRTPLYAYILEGTLTVEYDAGVVKEFAAGTALVDAMNVWLNSSNRTDGPVRVLMVHLGAAGITNSVQRP
ncbi:MAG: cupin domain-containing protein [Actinomycetota bacterium]|nr:cupin domain-containing protein [Actinomycetota bacterium]